MSGLNDLKSLNCKDVIKHLNPTNDLFSNKTDSGFLFVGDTSSAFVEALMNELYKHTKTSTDIPEKDFSDYFVMNEPSKEFMNERLKKIVAQNNKDYPSLLFRALVIDYAPKSIGWTLYTYGKAVLKRLELSRLHRLITMNVAEDSNSILDDRGKDANYEILKDKNRFAVESKFFDLVLCIICGLSIHKKLDLLSNEKLPCNDWLFSFKEASTSKGEATTAVSEKKKDITVLDLVRAALYDDLKREYFFKDQKLERLDIMIKYIKDHMKQFMNEQAFYSIWLVLSRFVSHTYWRSINVISDLSEKRKLLLQKKEAFEKDVLGYIAEFTSYSKLLKDKDRATIDAEDKQRLKIQDLMKRASFPLELHSLQ